MSGRTEGGAKRRRPSRPAASSPIATQRRSAHAGRAYSSAAARIEVLPPAERISLRAPAASVAALSKALGVRLPDRPKTSASARGRTALWLGPDEWLVIDEEGNDPLAACAGVSQLHSAVDVSHRNVAFSVAGRGAEALLNAGCPQDLALTAFPVGACSRTILGKIEIVLLRTAKETFRVECWRSFSDYAFAFLSDAARDPAG
ncbi:sarcosine oxidase subunit gamma [Arvimicrobium flavum]|uniref:sarcosine oxidase subunit gamma n=1 Tax=Arvimicrobium flavum TaxID=3393320 RepID=UPI00237B4A89|nr:sarcosine oxidase subunit gamma [Mesorhizobium shangrilense]